VSKKRFVFTEIMGEICGVAKEEVSKDSLAYRIGFVENERALVRVVKYLPIKGMIHIPGGDIGAVHSPWWDRIGPALSQSFGVLNKRTRTLLKYVFRYAYDFFRSYGLSPSLPREFNGPGLPPLNASDVHLRYLSKNFRLYVLCQ